jgi:predicted ester cyclase
MDTANADLVRSIMEAITAHDMGPVRPAYAATTTVTFPDRTCTGPDEVTTYFGGLFAALPDVELRPSHVVSEGDTVFARWRMTGTHTGSAWAGIEPTGARIELNGVDHFTIRDGVVVSEVVFFDQMVVARAMGLLPPDGSPGDKALKAAFNIKTKIADAVKQARSNSGD